MICHNLVRKFVICWWDGDNKSRKFNFASVRMNASYIESRMWQALFSWNHEIWCVSGEKEDYFSVPHIEIVRLNIRFEQVCAVLEPLNLCRVLLWLSAIISKSARDMLIFSIWGFPIWGHGERWCLFRGLCRSKIVVFVLISFVTTTYIIFSELFICCMRGGFISF